MKKGDLVKTPTLQYLEFNAKWENQIGVVIDFDTRSGSEGYIIVLIPEQDVCVFNVNTLTKITGDIQ
jgi:hypothetical protein